jgi:hypothetical protein
MKHIALLIGCFLISLSAHAQRANARLDKFNIKIGEPIQLELNAIYPKDLKCFMPVVNDSIASGFVLLNRVKTDSIFNAQTNEIELKKTYQITNFDTGMQTLPPFRFSFLNRTDTAERILSDPLTVRINLMAVDTTKDFKDIKEIIEVPFSINDYLPWIGLGAAIVAIIVGLILWWMKRKRPVVEKKPEIKLSALQIAMNAFELLEKEKLWQQGYIKQYYSKLTEILRTYFENHYQFPAMEQVTDEIIASLKNNNLAAEDLNKMKNLFVLADLVKFAKSSPGESDHIKSLLVAREFVLQSSSLTQITSKEE